MTVNPSSSPEDASSHEQASHLKQTFLGLDRLLGGALPHSEPSFEHLWAKLDAELDADAQQEALRDGLVFDDETVSAYLDGLLPKAETFALEQQFAVQPMLAQRVGGLLELQEKLRRYWVNAEDACCFDVTQKVMQRLEQEELMPVRQQPNWLELEQASALLDDEGSKTKTTFSLHTQQFQQQAIVLRQALSDYWLSYEAQLSSSYFSEAQVQSLVSQAGPLLTLLGNDEVEATTKTATRKNTSLKRPWRWWSHVAAGLLGVVLAGLLNSMPVFRQSLPFSQQNPEALPSADNTSFNVGGRTQLTSAWPFLQQASSRQLEPALPSVTENNAVWPDPEVSTAEQASSEGKHLACCRQERPSSEEYWLNNSKSNNSDDEMLLLLNL